MDTRGVDASQCINAETEHNRESVAYADCNVATLLPCFELE